MVFFDTCVWIELCGVRTPRTTNEIRQASAAGSLLIEMQKQNETIITCKEQLLEIVSAIQKITMRDYNRQVKTLSTSGSVGDLKGFRKVSAFAGVQKLCREVCKDVRHFCKVQNLGEYSIDSIINRIHLADINDCLYYDFCLENGVTIYTFDGDYKAIDTENIVSII